MSKEDKMIELLDELVRWTKVTSIPYVKDLLKSLSDIEKVAYHHSDGRSSREVAKVADVAFKTVANWWRKWYTLGIVEGMQVRGGTRYRRSFSLEDFDITVPQLQKEQTKAREEQIKGEEKT